MGRHKKLKPGEYGEMEYPRMVVKEEDGSWSVTYPDLVGVGGGGKTVQEAVREAEENRKVWTETRLEEGLPVPIPGKPSEAARLTLRLPRSLKVRLELEAAAEGVPLNTYCLTRLAEGGRRGA